MANVLSGLRFSRSSKIFITLIILALIITPTSFYLIKRNQAGADLNNSNEDSSTQYIYNKDESIGYRPVMESEDGSHIEHNLSLNSTVGITNQKLTVNNDDLIKRAKIANTIIVKLKAGANIEQINKLSSQAIKDNFPKVEISSSHQIFNPKLLSLGLKQSIESQPEKTKEIEKKFNDLNLTNIFSIKINNSESISDQIIKLNNNPRVEYAQPNREVLAQMVPNDSFYNKSRAWSQDYDNLWGLKKLNLEPAWDKSQGDGITVAVTDTGVDYNHEDLAGNIWTNPNEISGNNIDDDDNGFVDDTHGWDFLGADSRQPQEDNNPIDIWGHGTHVAGTIAAVGNNNVGIIGVAPKVKIMPVKMFDDDAYGDEEAGAKAIFYAANNGAKIINASWGGSGRSPIIQDVITYAYNIKNAITVVSAGNRDFDTAYQFPANATYVITVSSTDHNDQKSDFSNWGDEVKLSAPGGDSYFDEGNYREDWNIYPYVNILSLRANNSNMYEPMNNFYVGTNYYRARGTSMSSPHVSGVLALIWALNQQFNKKSVEKIAISTADDLGTSGWDKYFGNGRVNGDQAVASAWSSLTDISSPTTPSNLTANAVHSRKVDISFSSSTDDTFLVGYKIYRNGGEIADILENSYSDTTVSQGATYQYEIKAYDANNNLSSPSAISVSTPIDDEPPQVPTNLTANAFATKVDLSWTASIDNYYVSGYKVYRNDLEIADINPAKTDFTDFDIQPKDSLTYTIKSYDPENNLSSPSDAVSLVVPERYFIDSNSSFQQSNSNVNWGDYDNDGDLDFIEIGYGFKGPTDWTIVPNTTIYRNDRNKGFTDINTTIPDLLGGTAKWVDYDNDKDLDLTINGYYKDSDDSRTYLRSIFRNNGNDLFTEIDNQTAGLPRSTFDTLKIAWGDYNNDGDLDLVGNSDSSPPRCKIYSNLGQTSFTASTTLNQIKGCGRAAWGDYNNDGYLDLVINGYDFSTPLAKPITIVYKNINGARFKIALKLVDYNSTDSYWIDYDNDGDLDLIISRGLLNGGYLKIFQNNQGSFIDILPTDNPFSINNVITYDSTWGDYDNDGDMDIMVGGFKPVVIDELLYYAPSATLYRNEGNNQFRDIGSEFSNEAYSDFAWGDYDRDGDLDLLANGCPFFCINFPTLLYKNQVADSQVFNQPNQKPFKPTNLTATLNSNLEYVFKWNNAADTETPTAGLYYNLRLGTTNQGNEIASSSYGTPLLGNYIRPKITALKPGRKIKNLPSGKYYWSVQTIDSGLKTSNWSTEKILNVP